MSLDIRYLTNGKKTCHTVLNSGVTPIQLNTYEHKEDIPESIRHYAPEGKPTFVGPDLANILGVQEVFYPNFPKCGLPDCKVERCIAEACVYAPSGDWTRCPHFPGYEETVAKN